MDFINIFKIIEQKKNFEHGEPQSEQQIRNLEDELNVQFSESYKQFLRMYGYMAWFGGSIYGSSKNEYYDLLIRNREARKIELPDDFMPLPQDAFVFKEYGGGGNYMLFSTDSPRTGQVGLFLDETFNTEEQTWDSFEAFLEDYYCS